MIEVRDLQRSFGEIRAVNGVSFRAEDGQITGLLGPNGAGKTTTLRMLYTLLRPDSGQIHVDDVDALADSLAARRRLGVLPDARGLYKRFTARENIEYFGRLHGIDSKLLKQRVDRLIDNLDMQDIEHRRADGFSQGQRVKTAIARALVHEPRNILLDEPTNGLDVMATRSLRRYLLALKAQGHCVVLSSHVMQEVAALCDRIVVIAHGRVVAQGTAEELRQQTGATSLEDAFVSVIGSGEGLMA
ncbi:MAG: ATP-binding cassette domain-containing protein [Pseudomonadota bacterium]|nr:ATP-binding cassette domain-containing protein [Pseudomonadota bacterium]